MGKSNRGGPGRGKGGDGDENGGGGGESGDYQSRLEGLIEQVFQAGDHANEARILEEAIRLADAHGDADMGFRLRLSLIEAATFGGMPEKSVLAYSWCLAQCRRDPENFDESRLLWQSKWVLDALPEFPAISRQQIEDALRDMRTRLEQAGAGLRPVHKLRCTAAIRFGDAAAADAAFQDWRAAPKDWISDCEACDLDDQVRYFAFRNEPLRALEVAAPILSGQRRCAEVPHLTYGRVLLPLFQLGRYEEARTCHQKGYRLARRQPEMLTTVAEHITFLVLTDNLNRAGLLFQNHLGWALDCKAPWRQWVFQLSALFFLQRLESIATKPRWKLRLPARFPLFRADHLYQLSDLSEWFSNAASALGQAFDTRNGNHACRTALDQTLPDLTRRIHPFPVAYSPGSSETPENPENPELL